MKMGWLKREAIVEGGGAIEDEETLVYIMGSLIFVSHPTPLG